MGFVMGSIVNQDPSQLGQAATKAGQNPGIPSFESRIIPLFTTTLQYGLASWVSKRLLPRTDSFSWAQRIVMTKQKRDREKACKISVLYMSCEKSLPWCSTWLCCQLLGSNGVCLCLVNAASPADLLKNMQAQMGGPWAQARNFAVITGVHAGIAAAVRRIRKKDDTYTAYESLIQAWRSMWDLAPW